MHHQCCGPHQSGDCQPKAAPSCGSIILLPSRLLTATLCSAAEVIRKTFDGDYGSCSQCQEKVSDCAIPEMLCPDPCVCRIHWSGCAGDTLNYRIEVANSGKKEREFSLIPGKFECTDDMVKVMPDKATLAPAESFQAVISFTIPETFSGGVYHAQIRLLGAYEQFIRIHLGVRPRQACCCRIDQGEIPKRTKAHHWFHHFQCEQSCFEPAQKTTS